MHNKILGNKNFDRYYANSYKPKLDITIMTKVDERDLQTYLGSRAKSIFGIAADIVDVMSEEEAPERIDLRGGGHVVRRNGVLYVIGKHEGAGYEIEIGRRDLEKRGKDSKII